MLSKIDGRSYHWSNTFNHEHPRGIWRISHGTLGEAIAWEGAEGEDIQDNGEPPRALCEAFVALLGYDHRDVPEPAFNVVESLLADPDDCAFDQPCAHGNRVENHAVYCHNGRWLFAPRKCRRHQGASIWGEEPWPHERCAGFRANPAVVKAKEPAE